MRLATVQLQSIFFNKLKHLLEFTNVKVISIKMCNQQLQLILDDNGFSQPDIQDVEHNKNKVVTVMKLKAAADCTDCQTIRQALADQFLKLTEIIYIMLPCLHICLSLRP